jgi:hypothetical protein
LPQYGHAFKTTLGTIPATSDSNHVRHLSPDRVIEQTRIGPITEGMDIDAFTPEEAAAVAVAIENTLMLCEDHVEPEGQANLALMQSALDKLRGIEPLEALFDAA